MSRRGIVLLIVGVGAGLSMLAAVAWQRQRDAPTVAYLAGLDLDAIALRGCDFTSPRFDPERIGKAADDIDTSSDYDFDRLDAVRARLAGVDRTRALAEIFARLTAGCTTNTERHVAVLRFLHRASYHAPFIRPIERDGTPVTDPLIILELNEMRCGQVSRLAVDLFDAGGFPARCVALTAHTVAEVHYDGDWHFLDADSAGGDGLTVFDADGSIPSVRELSRAPERLDALPYRFELRHNGRPRVTGMEVRSINYFHRRDGGTPLYYFARKDPAEFGDPTYGWDSTICIDPDWERHDLPSRTQPGAVRFLDVQTADDGRSATVTWEPARDPDGDVLGYRVFVGSAPRGWSYRVFAGRSLARKFWHDTGGWEPGMYGAMFRLPPDDVARLETTEPSVRIDLVSGATRYVTVMPFDAYHERVGKILYPMSNELALTGAE